jgi:hypothetical protein
MPPADPRDRVIFALDVEDEARARALVAALRPSVGTFKVGLELLLRGGVELAARFGYSAFQGTDASAWVSTVPAGNPLQGLGAGPAFDAAVGVRLHPRLSLGLTGGAYARIYLTPGLRAGAIDPWVGIGVGFAAHFDATRRVTTSTTTTMTTEYSFSYGALTLPLSAGFDIHVARRLALGVWASATVWFPNELCTNSFAGNVCFVEAASLGLPVRFEPNVAWQAGASVRYTIGW